MLKNPKIVSLFFCLFLFGLILAGKKLSHKEYFFLMTPGRSNLPVISNPAYGLTTAASRSIGQRPDVLVLTERPALAYFAHLLPTVDIVARGQPAPEIVVYSASAPFWWSDDDISQALRVSLRSAYVGYDFAPTSEAVAYRKMSEYERELKKSWDETVRK